MKTWLMWILELTVSMPIDHGFERLAVGSAGKSSNRKTIVSGMRKSRRTMLKKLMRRWKAIVRILSELQDRKRGIRAIAEVYEAQMWMVERSLRPVNSFMLIRISL
jgi:hypothetical protein